MDLARMLRELWGRKLWVFLGFLAACALGIHTAYQVDPGSLSLKKKGLEFGAATTQILIDSRNSALPKIGDTQNIEPFDPLSKRADVYARLMTSTPLKREIAQNAGLGSINITARPPIADGQTQAQQPSEQRADQLLNQGASYRLFFDVQPGLPVISAYAEAPTTRDAVKLVTGVAPTLKAYIARLEKQDPASPNQQIRVTQLGVPRGGIVNSGASMMVALLAFFGLFLGACILITVVSTVARDWRRVAALERGDIVWRRPTPDRADGGPHVVPVPPESEEPEVATGRALERFVARRGSARR
jgi:hypothetical protein